MNESEEPTGTPLYPAGVSITAATRDRNRLTTFFRFILSIPHLLLVGGPLGFVLSIGWTGSEEAGLHWQYGSAGVLGAVACVVSMIGWFAIVFTGRYPDGLYKLAAFYLRWRVRAVAYMALLRDEYPPFGDEPYPSELVLEPVTGERDRLTVGLRIFLVIPHLIAIWALSIAWAFTTAIAWIMIILTGEYPESLYGFAIGVFAWGVRVEAYTLLLTDEYPPFTLRA